jgi:hypothetical protein
VSAALKSAEVASDAAARSPRASRSDPVAVLATEAVNRASEAAEISWPTTLTRAARGFPLKYRRISAGSEPGRG